MELEQTWIDIFCIVGRKRRYSNGIYLLYKIQVIKQFTKDGQSSNPQSKRQVMRKLCQGSNSSQPMMADWWLYYTSASQQCDDIGSLQPVTATI